MRPKLASGMTTLADQNGGVSALTYIDTGGTLANTSAGNSTASGRRVRLPWGGDNTFDFNALNANGLVLTRRAIVWALGQKLVGHWKLDEASGTTAADATPYGQDGAVSGGASWSNRCDGSGVFDFNGSTHYISIADATQLHPNARLSIAAWIKGDSWGSGGEVNAILRKGETDPNNFQLAVADGKVALYLDDSDVGGIRGNTTLNVGTWYHVVATWDGLTAKIYLNGVLDNIPTSRTGTISTDTRPLYIGGRSGADHFDGMIYDVRLHDYALSPAEIGQLYGLVGDWKLDETTGTTAADSSLLGNNGTYQGGVSLAASSPVPGSGALAAVFDGTSGHVPVADESAYDVTGPISVAAWIKVAAFTASGQAILTKGNNAWRLTRNANTNTIQFACTGLSPDYVNGTKNVSDGGWHLLVGVYDGSSLTLYVDGVVDGTVSSTGSISTNDYDVEIGGNSQSGGREFDGAIYDARVYNRALCPAEVQTLYGGGSGTSGVRIIKWVEIQ